MRDWIATVLDFVAFLTFLVSMCLLIIGVSV